MILISKVVNKLRFLKNNLFDLIFIHLPPKGFIAGHRVLFRSQSNTIIKNYISSGKPFLLSRLGTTEAAITKHYLIDPDKPFPQYLKSNLATLSGFFPEDDENQLRQFCQLYVNSLRQADIIGARADRYEKDFWVDEEFLLKHCKPSVSLINLPDIEPFAHSAPWTQLLKDKTVLVIHPCKESIESQFTRRDVLFGRNKILPSFNLIALKSVQSLSKAKFNCGYYSYFEALEAMKSQIQQIDFDIALIGAGAYGLPLASYCKALGKQAIHIGGALQTLFGILGKRWENDSNIARFVNDNWIYPAASERPVGYEQVENGCYW